MGRGELDADCQAFFKKFSWEAYPSKHLKYFEIGAYDLELSMASDAVCHITDQKMTDSDCQALAKCITVMKPEMLRQIYLSKNDIGDDGTVALAAAIKAVSNIEILFMARNHVGSKGLAALAEQCGKVGLWQLVMTENSIDDAGVIALADVVTKDPENFAEMRWLFLDENEGITEKGVVALAKSFVHGFRNLERLALHNCKIGNNGLAALAEAINRGGLPQCEYLYIQRNSFDEEGKAILKAAAKPKGIKVHYGWPPPMPGVDYD